MGKILLFDILFQELVIKGVVPLPLESYSLFQN